MSRSALLLLSAATIRRPSQIRFSLSVAIENSNICSGTLYVQMWKSKSSSDPPNHTLLPGNNIQILSQACSTVYSFASSQCPNVDVRFVVKNECLQQLSEPRQPISLVYGDAVLKKFECEVQNYVNTSFPSTATTCSPIGVQFLPSSPNGTEEQGGTAPMTTKDSFEQFDVVALGGTFDRMHNGHKILLTEAVLRCRKELIVGVTNEDMIKSKLLNELIQPCDVRIKIVQDFLEEISPPLVFRVLPISDPFGPTIVEKDIHLIVVSQETTRGAAKINEIRHSKGFPPLHVHTIDLVADPVKQSEHEEDKISSSTRRLRILGTRLRPPLKEPSLPYIIGLTGGSASGKSTICEYLNTLNVATINCDQLGHQAYSPGTPCFDQIVQTFGADILTEDKSEINRRALGSKVFGRKDELKKLTDIVWPEIRRLAQAQIQEFTAQGHKIIVVDAAVLLEAGWQDFCHDIWVVFVPKDEAIRRIEERDKLPREAAENRINSQMSTKERLASANFAFCSLWEKEFTRTQVDKALTDIQCVIRGI